MRFKTFTNFTLFIALILSVMACSKDDPLPNATPTPIPDGGMVSGVYKCCNQTVIDSFMMSDVTGRLTSLGGFSFEVSNDSYELLFFFPEVNDTGFYASSFVRTDYLKIIENGDTTTMDFAPVVIHISQFDQFSNYTLISGTFRLDEIRENFSSPAAAIDNGVFTNIPLVHNVIEGHYVIYQGEKTNINTPKILITDNMYFSQFRFEDNYVESHKYQRGNSDFARSNLTPYGRINSEIDILEVNAAENLVSGKIKTVEEIDLELHFQDVEYIEFPELEDGQVAVVFNYGEEILYFDSAKYVVNEFSPNQVMISAFEGESTEINISVFYNPVDPFPYQGQSFVNNSGLTYLESTLDGHSHLDFIANTNKLNFEFGRTMGSGIYRQLCIKGKNIRREM